MPTPSNPSSSAGIRLLILLAGSFLATGSSISVHAETSASLTDRGWELLRQYQFTQAQQAFSETAFDTPQSPDRITRLGAALATLNHPALKFQARDDSLAELNQLWETRGQTPDNAGLWAGYALGRWKQNYHSHADFDQALDWFERTAAEGDLAYVSQLARLKATGLWLYAPLKSNPDVPTRLARARAADSQIADRGLRVSYLLLLIDGLLLHRSDHQEILNRLEEVWALDIPNGQPRAKTLCQLGTLSSLTGQTEKAIRYYRQFLSEFPIDIRTQLVRDHLTELTAATKGERS